MTVYPNSLQYAYLILDNLKTKSYFGICISVISLNALFAQMMRTAFQSKQKYCESELNKSYYWA